VTADDEAHAVPIGDTLDLHTFRPDECADLVAEYVRVARAAGLHEVRVVHGKGTGALRRLVHAALERSDDVARYRMADENWGATIVELAPR
jgi:DNA-nicking Smr family endonuclease